MDITTAFADLTAVVVVFTSAIAVLHTLAHSFHILIVPLHSLSLYLHKLIDCFRAQIDRFTSLEGFFHTNDMHFHNLAHCRTAFADCFHGLCAYLLTRRDVFPLVFESEWWSGENGIVLPISIDYFTPIETGRWSE